MFERLAMLQRLNDQLLIHIYVKAMTLKLDSHFIYLLEEEINRRNLSLMDYETGYTGPENLDTK